MLEAVSPDNYHFLWREHEPQHFSTKGSDFELGGLPLDGVFNNYRNEIAEQYMKIHKLLENTTGKIRGIVRIYDRLKNLTNLHHKGDCTHYCFSPWRLKITWHAIYEAMHPADFETPMS